MLLEITQETVITVVAGVIAVIFLILGPLRLILKKNINEKYHKIFYAAVDFAETWAKEHLEKHGVKPSSIAKLEQASKFAEDAIHTGDPETIIRGVEGALARTKIDKMTVDQIAGILAGKQK